MQATQQNLQSPQVPSPNVMGVLQIRWIREVLRLLLLRKRWILISLLLPVERRFCPVPETLASCINWVVRL